MQSPALGAARDFLRAHPRATLAVKGAIAAGLAWVAVQPVQGVASDYPYYAPLGAVVATTTTVVSAVRASVQSVAAIAVGAALGLAGHVAPMPQLPALMLAVGLGIVAGGLRLLGGAGAWVPIAALFVLILGGDDPAGYVLAYAGLTGLGALIGIAVNMVLPQLPLTPAARAQELLRSELVHQLHALADALETDDPLDGDSWRGLTGATSPTSALLDTMLSEAREARRGNWRTPRWAEWADEQERHSHALESVGRLVDEVAALMADERNPVHRSGAVERALRHDIAAALRATAGVLEARGEDPPYAEADAAVAHLRQAALAGDLYPEEERLVAAAVSLSLGRALDWWR